MPNALLVYPQHPPSYWAANYTLDLLRIKSAYPPLGLLTIAAMFPPAYDVRVVDMNGSPLEESDLAWADLVLTSTMISQRESLPSVIERCRRAGVPVVAGGPYPTAFHDEIEGVDHFVLDEAEEIFPEFLRDLETGTAKAIYREPRKPDVTRTPVPRFDLIDVKAYYAMGVQFSRGCPFECEFCDIIKLYGRVPRTKKPEQVVKEFEALYRLGWRGNVFLVDDNFISNKRDALKLLPVIAEWQKARRYPFSLLTEASVNMARMDELMARMIEAGFNSVFLGIESPNPKALIQMKKPQNVSKREEENYLLQSVRKIQQQGMQVMGGFILGLDGDDADMFDAQIEFIHEAGIPMASVYLLTALKGTDLYDRLKRENRLLDVSVGTNVTILNFKPQMNSKTLIEGWRRVLSTIYDPTLEKYFKRCLTLFEHLKPNPHLLKPVNQHVLAGEVIAIRRRLSAKQVSAYTQFIAKVSKERPRMLPEAITLAAMGYHFEKVSRQQIEIYDFKEFLATELEKFREAVLPHEAGEMTDQRQKLFTRVQARYESIPDDFRYPGDGIEQALQSFRSSVNARTDWFTHVAVK